MSDDMQLLGEIIDAHLPEFLAFCFGQGESDPLLGTDTPPIFERLEALFESSPEQAGHLLHGLDQVRRKLIDLGANPLEVMGWPNPYDPS